MSKPKVVTCGMSRSGSTVIWQITQALVGEGLVAKTHNHLPHLRDVPVIISVRHPHDASASFARVKSSWTASACGPILSSGKHVAQYRQGHPAGLLEIRYEDWFPDTRFLALTIHNWLSLQRIIQGQTYEHVCGIAEQFSLDANRRRADEQGDWDSYDPSHHIHGRHIGTGKPYGADAFPPDQRERVKTKLAALCMQLGYTIQPPEPKP